MEMIVLFNRACRISGVASWLLQCSKVGWNWRKGIQVGWNVSSGVLMEFRKAQ
jgi:hypothetical protein